MTSGPAPQSPIADSDSDSSTTSPIVVSGLGAVSGYGWSAGDLERGLFSGNSSIGPARRFPVEGHRTTVLSEVPEPSSDGLPDFVQRYASGAADRFALVAAAEAVAQAGLEVRLRDRLGGVFFSGSTAGMAEAEDFFFTALEGGAARLRKTRGHTLNAPGDCVARALGIRGPVVTVSSACASGTLAFGVALDALRSGEVDYAIVGGADALCQLTYAGFNALRAMDEQPCRPFRRERVGMSLGEGAGVLILEPLRTAEQRSATPLAVVLGAGASCDAHHMTAPEASGHGAALSMQRALEDAQCGPEDIHFLNAHGTGTEQNDIAEWHAMEEIFADRARTLPVTSTKSALGHLLGAAGVVEAIATIFCFRRGQVHATYGEGTRDQAMAVDLVVESPRWIGRGRKALSTNLAFGGANASVVLADWHEEGS